MQTYKVDYKVEAFWPWVSTNLISYIDRVIAYSFIVQRTVKVTQRTVKKIFFKFVKSPANSFGFTKIRVGVN